MSRLGFPTVKEIRKNFDECLKKAMELGIWPPTETGLDTETLAAIREVAKAWPTFNSNLVQKAKTEFSKQLDGTHVKEELDQLMARFEK